MLSKCSITHANLFPYIVILLCIQEAETEAATDGLAAEVAKRADNVTPAQNLDATAEQMGFVTVEFVHAPPGGR